MVIEWEQDLKKGKMKEEETVMSIWDGYIHIHIYIYIYIYIYIHTYTHIYRNTYIKYNANIKYRLWTWNL